jgi:beta-barrel assembly-enhancing protease
MHHRLRLSISVIFILLVFTSTSCNSGLLNRSKEEAASTGARPAPHFEPGFNLFTPEQDIQLGKESAQQISQQVTVLKDEIVTQYIKNLGTRLASHAPGHKYPYQFTVVADKDINAFALPGGIIFVNAGAIVAAKNEGELAGVIAHEITHVALRHGTNQASKAYLAKAGLGILTAIASSGENPEFGQIINVIGGAGANMVFLKFGRTAENQADLEGARIMAEAGYDPRDMANFFKTLQAMGGQGVPEFLSDHPDPGNRVAAINEIVPSLRVSANPIKNTNEFQQVKSRLTGKQASLVQSNEPPRIGPSDPNNNKPGGRPDLPANEFEQFEASDGSFIFQYPRNWDALVADNSTMIFAPKGAYGQIGRSLVVTHGMFIGTVPAKSNDLNSATEEFIKDQLSTNPDFRVIEKPQPINLSGNTALATTVAGPSTVTGVIEIDIIYTVITRDGNLFYLITMTPEDEVDSYKPAFNQITSSIALK